MTLPSEYEKARPLSGVTPSVPNFLAKEGSTFLCEYGVRLDDSAMVFHFYVSPQLGGWPRDFADRLKAAIDQTFDVSKVSADYSEDINSFCVIVGGLGMSPDPWPLVEKFFRRVDPTTAS